MRKITCQCCDFRYSKTPAWMVWDNLIICDSCRLAVIQYWTQVLGFSFAPHPFFDEFVEVESRTTGKNPLDIQRRM